VVLNFENYNKLFYFENKDGYFNSSSEIKLNVITHSSGGVALRRYFETCRNEKLDPHVNLIVNLSAPQKGARMNYQLKKAFPELINLAVNNLISKKGEKIILLNENKEYTYEYLINKTNIMEISGSSLKARAFRKLIGDYILYNIPFDNKKSVLGKDTVLYDLHSNHMFIKKLNKTAIPESIRIYNYKVISPYSGFFNVISKCLGLGQNNGVVDILDTNLDNLSNYEKLWTMDVYVPKANHIPFPYIKSVFEIRATIEQNYSFLKIMLKGKFTKQEGLDII